MNMLLIVLAAATGLGAFLIVRELFPAPPALRPALARFTNPAQVRPGLGERLAATPLARRVPRQDLALLGQAPEAFLARQAAYGLAGLAVPALAWTVLQPPLPWVALPMVTVVSAVVLIATPVLQIRTEAARAREDFREALIAYLDLVALARTAGAAPAGALEIPVRICRGWAFGLLAHALDPARRGTASTWDALSALAVEVGLPELGETAATIRLAGTQGSAIAATLAARAQSMRESRLAAALAKAKSRTESMTIPMTAAVAGFVILLGYPALIRMTGG